MCVSVCNIYKLSSYVWLCVLHAVDISTDEMRCSCFGGSSGSREKDDEIVVSGNIKQLSYKELKTATDDFNPDNKIGRGGFGIVYKVLLVFAYFDL